MKRTILIALAIGGLYPALPAQDNKQAEQIVAGFIQSLEQQAVKADFNLTVGGDTPAQTLNGTFLMKGNKFAIDMEGISIFFDGKTQWSYVEANNEVSISEPDVTELNEINPMSILREYRDKSNITFAPGHKAGTYPTILLTPTDANINSITVQLNQKADKPAFIKIDSGNAPTIQVDFSNFETGVNIPDNRFVFNKDNYEGVYENDLR